MKEDMKENKLSVYMPLYSSNETYDSQLGAKMLEQISGGCCLIQWKAHFV